MLFSILSIGVSVIGFAGFAVPLLFCMLESCHCKDILCASGQQFATAFATHLKNHERSQATKSAEMKVKARAALKMQAEAAGVWAEFLSRFPKLLTCGDGLACEPYHVGVEGGCSTAASEQEFLASLRVVRSGTRTVIAVPFSSAVETFGALEPVALWGKFFSATEPVLKSLKKMYAITHGVGEALYLPAGWLFAERVTKVDCLCNMSRGIVLCDPQALSEIDTIMKILPSNAKELDKVKKIHLVLGEHAARSQQLAQASQEGDSVEPKPHEQKPHEQQPNGNPDEQKPDEKPDEQNPGEKPDEQNPDEKPAQVPANKGETLHHL